jgi:hypothetical protein
MRENPSTDAAKLDFQNLLTMFDHAFSKGLKFPAIEIWGGIHIKRTGEKSSMGPGCLVITDGGKYPNNKLFFMIKRDCTIVLCKDYLPKVEEIVRRFSLNPTGGALESSKITHACCFCGIGLTNQESISRGYGPICAINYGLPHNGN